MKRIFLLGGLIGFIASASAGLLAGRSPNRVFFDAACGCLVSAFLFRWLWSICQRGFCETYQARQRAAAVAAAAAAAATAATPPAGAAKKPKT